MRNRTSPFGLVRGWSTNPALGIGLALAIIATALAIRDLRHVLIDDAAITFRYAERIAGGKGFTYNDFDRTNGASAPGYTLLLALLRWAGIDAISSASAVGVACYAATVGGVGVLCARVGSTGIGLGAGLLLVLLPDFRSLSLVGMESGLAASLGVAAIGALIARNPTALGLILGLAIFNKADAGLLAVACIGTWRFVYGRMPWKSVATASVVFVPWVLFAWFYFGSPVPFSATQKLGSVGDPTSSHDITWLARRMVSGFGLTLVALVALVVLSKKFWPLLNSRQRALGLSLSIWSGSHFLAFSLVDLGDPYPWYSTVLYPAVSILVVGAMAVQLRWFSIMDSSHRWIRRSRLVFLAGAGLLLILASADVLLGPLSTTASVAVSGHQLSSYEEFEGTRRAAGNFLGDMAEEGDVVQTCWGWVAYGAPQATIRETCPLSTRHPTGPARWFVESISPGDESIEVPPGSRLVAAFKSCGSNPGASFVFEAVDADDQGEQPLPRGGRLYSDQFHCDPDLALR